MDMYKRDRFELLIAYLDGELTAAKRRQVTDWHTTDPGVQQLYARVLKLRQKWQMMPLPPAQPSVEYTVRQISPRLNIKPKMAVVLGSTVFAAVFIATLSVILLGHQFPVPTLTQVSQSVTKPGR